MKLKLALLISFFLSLSLHAAQEKENIILLHGYANGKSNMAYMEKKLAEANFKITTIGYPSLRKGIAFAEGIIEPEIEKVFANSTSKVHLIGHSAGGLLIRSYLQKNTFENLGRVINMGSPAGGTPVVELAKRFKLGPVIGPFASELGTLNSDFLDSLEPPLYDLGIIAGTLSVPGFEVILPGEDDGLVQVESTKVEGMKDFIQLHLNHATMKYSQSALDQAIHFLRTGEFTIE